MRSISLACTIASDHRSRSLTRAAFRLIALCLFALSAMLAASFASVAAAPQGQAHAAQVETKTIASPTDLPDPDVGKYVYITDMSTDNYSCEVFDDGLVYADKAEDVDSLYETNGFLNAIMSREGLSAGATRTYDGGDGPTPAFTIKFSNAGYTSDGDAIDLIVSFDNIQARWYRSETAHSVFCCIETSFNGDASRERLVASSQRVASTQDISVRIVYAGTDEAASGYAFRFDASDIDQRDKVNLNYTGLYAESIVCVDGFEKPVYVSNDTMIDVVDYQRDGETYTRYRATAGDSNTFRSGITTYIMDGEFSFVYTGSDCGITVLASSYAPGAPDIGAPSKSSTPDAARGEQVEYQVLQTVPYTIEETLEGNDGNSYSSLTLTDALDPSIDAVGADVRVYRADTKAGTPERDDTSNWSVSRNGQTLTVSCKSPSDAGGEYRFVISTSVRETADLSDKPSSETQDGDPAKRVDNEAVFAADGQSNGSNKASVSVPTAKVLYKLVGDIPTEHSAVPLEYDGYIGDAYTAEDAITGYPEPGYSFAGWYASDPTAGAAEKWADGTVLTQPVTVLYGLFTHNAAAVEYRIVGDTPPSYGQLPERFDGYAGDTYDAADPITEMSDGWTFDGWYASDPTAGAAEKWTDGTALPMGTTVLYGRFSHTPARVEYVLVSDDNPQDASTPPSPVDAYEADEYRVADGMSTSSSEAWHFNGWYLDEGLSNPAPDTITLPSGTTKLYGEWQRGSISLSKTASPGTVSDAEPGSVVEYTLVATNTGESDLTGVVVSDAMLGGDIYDGGGDTLAPGGSIERKVEYRLTQADIDAGTVLNTASAYGVDPDGTRVSDEDDATVSVEQAPGIELVKEVDGEAVIENAHAGDEVRFGFRITNTGNTTLETIRLADALPGVSLDIAGMETTLAPGESTKATGSYTITQADIDAGGITNKATATGTAPDGGTVEDEDDATVDLPASPSLKLVKTADPSQIADPAAGESAIAYSFAVTNTGNVTLNSVTVNDPRIGTGTSLTVVPSTLAPGESGTANASYTLTQVDVDAGCVLNTATATGQAPDGSEAADTDDATVRIDAHPSIGVVKEAGTDRIADASPGDAIDYTITITNTGDVTLTGITANDPLLGGVLAPDRTTLAPGESATARGSYAITQADIDKGSVHNTATATGAAPDGSAVDDSDDADVALEQSPAIALDKAANRTEITGAPGAGTTITYTFTVDNTGNTTLTGITLEDPLTGGDLTGALGARTLAPGEKTTATAVYAITQADIDAGRVDNTATATGTGPGDSGTVRDDDTATVMIEQAPGVSLAKEVVGDTVIEDAHAGDTVEFLLTVRNTGNVTLTDVALTDLLEGAVLDDSAVSESLAPGGEASASVSYVLTQEDVDRGDVLNIARVDAVSPSGVPVEAEDDAGVGMPSSPAIALDKAASADEFANARAGDTVIFTMTVTNTGNTTLTGIALTDEMLGGDLTALLDKKELAPGESTQAVFEYSLTQEDIDSGRVVNVAAATGLDPHGASVSDENDAVVALIPSPAISLVKEVSPACGKDTSELGVGDEVEYSFAITNEGNVTLSGITLTDDMLGGNIDLIDAEISGADESTGAIEDDGNEGADANGASSASSESVETDEEGADQPAADTASITLEPGESISVSVPYEITQDDMDRGLIDNHAIATGTPPASVGEDGSEIPSEPVSDDDDAIIELSQHQSIALEKSPDSARIDGAVAGDEIVWTLTVSNDGNVSLGGIELSDSLPGIVLEASALDGAVLAPGESMSVRGIYAITDEDIAAGAVLNTADVTALAVSPDGAISDNADPITAHAESEVALTAASGVADIALSKTGIGGIALSIAIVLVMSASAAVAVQTIRKRGAGGDSRRTGR